MNRDRLSEQGQTKSSVWEGLAGIGRTHKQGLQELEGQPEPPRLGSSQCLPLPGMGLQSLLKMELVCLAVFLCILVCVNSSFLICVTLPFLFSVNRAFLICVKPAFLICVNQALLC